MRFSDMSVEKIIDDKDELECALNKRYGGLNYIVLGDAISNYPMLIIMVNEGLAWLYFLSDEEHVGYYSVGSIPGLDPHQKTRFVSPGPQDEERRNDELVPFSSALLAAQQFFADGRIPTCIQWREPLAD
jgi:hypothetical protein